MHHIGAEGLADRLAAEAHPEDRHHACELAHHVEGDPRVLGTARPRREHDGVRGEGPDPGDVHRVVSVDVELCPQLTELLDEVVDERVVVVDDEEPDGHGEIVGRRLPTGRPRV